MADDECRAMWDNLTLGYTESDGLPLLREEISKLYTTTKASDIVVAVPQEIVFLAMTAVVKPGDHVVVTTPGYQSLYEVARAIGAEVTPWTPTPGKLEFDVAELEGLMRPNTKLVVANFPHNPTGFMPTREAWDRMIDACRAKGAYLFSDEMYRLLELDGSERIPSGVDSYEKGMTLFGMSKSFGLPGLRLGWLATRDEAAMARVKELKDYTTICSPGPSEVLALIGLRARDKIIAGRLELLQSNLALLDAFFSKHLATLAWERPRAGTICFPKVINGEGSEAFCMRVLKETGILLLPSTVYDHAPTGEERFRLGFGRADMPKVLAMLDEFLSKK